MVTFRFYLVSTVAFFLAMAVGVVVGSVLDEGLVTSLENRLDTVEANLDETAALIDEKRAEIDDLDRYVEESAPFAVEGRLEDSSALVVAEEGIDAGAVERLVLRLRQAGARVEGIAWLLPEWDLTDPELRDRLVDDVGIELGDEPTEGGSDEGAGDVGSQLRQAVWSLLVEQSGPADPGDATTPTTDAPTTDGPTTAPAAPPGSPTTAPADAAPVAPLDSDVLSLLDELGIVRVERLDDDGGADGGPLVLAVVAGADSELATPGATAVELAETAAEGGVPTVLAEALPEDGVEEDRRAVISQFRRGRRHLLDGRRRGPHRRTRRHGARAVRRARRHHRALRTRVGRGRHPAPMAGTVTTADGGASAVVRSAAGMGAAAAVSRAFGALRVLVVAGVLGTTYLGNAFQSSNTVSNVLFELLAAGALSAVLVPSFVGHLDRNDRAGAERLAGELLGITLLVLGLVAVIGMAAAPWLADLLTAAVDDPDVVAAQRQLTTVLLWFFIPQVVLYGVGAIATAVLHAQRRFVVPALAPIGNTVVMVAFLGLFRWSAGPGPGLDLSGAEQALLGLGGTLGVLAFVAAPTIAVWRSGFRLQPRFSRTHEGLSALLRLSGWASVQHGVAAVLLGAAIVAGGSVEGGVVAYQVGWFFFLAPYGIIAQPIHTAILPELVAENEAGASGAFSASVRWALDSMGLLLIPISALALALSVPAMTVLAFGQASGSQSVDLLAAALASLTLGLLPYGGFLLLARVWYVLGDSRTPAAMSAVGAVVGVAIMAVAAFTTTGTATVFALGVAHSVAYLVGALGLLVALRRRTGVWVAPTLALRAIGVAGLVAVAAWVVADRWDPAGRGAAILLLVAVVPVALGLYVGLLRLIGVSVTGRIGARSRMAS